MASGLKPTWPYSNSSSASAIIEVTLYRFMKLFLTIMILFFHVLLCRSQDHFTGVWQLQDAVSSASPKVEMKLLIGNPSSGIFYPATIMIYCDSFRGRYQLLLLKRNSRQLAFSRNKYAQDEIPFSLGTLPVMLNGYLDFSRDLKGNPLLMVNRIPCKKFGTPITQPESAGPTYQALAKRIQDFLQQDSIRMVKNVSGIMNDSANIAPILETDAFYYGVLDSMKVNQKDGLIKFNNNNDNDIISVQLNGKKVIDQIDSKKKREPEEILLDTGMNFICFFADDYGKNHPGGAGITVEFNKSSVALNFTHPMNLGATFIVLPLYYLRDEDNDTRFESTSFPAFPQRTARDNPPFQPLASNNSSLQRNNKIVGSIISKSQQITLAIWDDALEDGDSISLSINGKWITQGLPVKNKPQFLYVTLEPGPNSIIFVADNLGSVVPNTSVLEIIDGKKRKSFMIDTDLSKNNQVNIYYEFKPDL
jgi:hypothetical protein